MVFIYLFLLIDIGIIGINRKLMCPIQCPVPPFCTFLIAFPNAKLKEVCMKLLIHSDHLNGECIEHCVYLHRLYYRLRLISLNSFMRVARKLYNSPLVSEPQASF